MESTIELVIKIIAAIGSAYGIVKAFVELKRDGKINLYEDFKYSKEIFEYIRNNSDLHPIIIEKGLRCLAGTKELSADEILYLLGLERPLRKIGQYIKANEYLIFNKQSNGKIIGFKGLYKIKVYRKLEYCVNYICAFIFLLIPFLSLLFYKHIPIQIGATIVITINIMLMFSFWNSIKTCAYIEHAEEIINNQEKDKRNLRDRFIKLFDDNKE